MLKQAGHIYDLSKTDEPDGVLLRTLEQTLKADRRRKLIVVHLMGSHTAYKFRYPVAFAHFSRSEAKPSGVEEIIDQYDNSVRYNDFLIASMLDMLTGQPEHSAMLYFSDHGEEVYDCRDFAGHAYEKVSRYMCEVPFIVWLPGDYRKKRKDLVFDEERPCSTADLLYGLSDLAKLSYEGYDCTRSLFSPQFVVRDRFVGEMTYENILQNTLKYASKNKIP